MDYYAAIRAFVRAVDLGSFSRAAEELQTKVSTVSRYVSGLEHDLGAALLNRSTRRLHLTEVGSGFYERAASILADLDDARTAARELNKIPQGMLRVTVPGAFGRHHVMPYMPAFLAAYPGIRVDLQFTDATMDLIQAGIDVAVRIGTLTDSSLVAKRLADQNRILVAGAAWPAGNPPLLSPDDLARHECLAFTLKAGATWYCRPANEPAGKARALPVKGRLLANDSDALLTAALAGLGIALLPDWLVAQPLSDRRLVRLLPDWSWTIAPGPEPAIWGVYPPKKIVSPKVRAFLDFMKSTFGDMPAWDQR